tara:strand:+ start:120 stop:347 length:228 start_codon:yes stop_codon:yes gene_type:complete
MTPQKVQQQFSLVKKNQQSPVRPFKKFTFFNAKSDEKPALISPAKPIRPETPTKVKKTNDKSQEIIKARDNITFE